MFDEENGGAFKIYIKKSSKQTVKHFDFFIALSCYTPFSRWATALFK